MHSFLYNTLLEVDHEQLGYKHGMATSFRLVDERTWEFTVPSDDALAEQLARYFRRIVSDEGIEGFPSPAKQRLPLVDDVSIDEERVIFHLSEPWPGFPAVMAKEPAARWTRSGSLVPTGDFELERWDHGNRVILRRRGPTPAGGFSRLWFEVVPSANERLRRVLNGTVDIAINLPRGSLGRLHSSGEARAILEPRNKVHFVELNVSRPPFDDVRVRRALNLALNMDHVLESALLEGAQPLAAFIPPTSLGHDPLVVSFGYDPTRARDLLTAAGYPGGFEFELDVNRSQVGLAREYQKMWELIGVRAVLRVWQDRSLWQDQVRYGQRQAWLTQWESVGPDPKEAVWDKVHSSGENNWGGYSSPVLDALLEQAEQTADSRLRLDQYRTVQRYLRQEAPYVFGHTEHDVYGIARDIELVPGGRTFLSLELARRKN